MTPRAPALLASAVAMLAGAALAGLDRDLDGHAGGEGDAGGEVGDLVGVGPQLAADPAHEDRADLVLDDAARIHGAIAVVGEGRA